MGDSCGLAAGLLMLALLLVVGVWGSRSGMLDLMAGEWEWFDWGVSILVGLPGESIRPPLRIVSSSSGVGGKGLEGPLAGTAVTAARAGSRGPEELR